MSMSTPPPPREPIAEPEPGGPRRPRRESARTGALLVLAILITLFAVFNLDQVKVNWVFGSGKAPLIIVIVISLLVGIVLTYFADRRARRR
ncbi:MAG: hypothetical protein QOK19_770 [Solirubrobacteraceae bacterium]|nr:hypothetical protein [Solirubrobacterales bacterium]MEA2215209.1 hypothetical protein [Solirubrobacteraceae bacterium]